MPKVTEKTSDSSENDLYTPRSISLSLILKGDGIGPGDWNFLTLFNNSIILETKWSKDLTLQCDSLPVDLKQPHYQSFIADKPLIFLVRLFGGKGAKDLDPLSHADNRAGATLDLFPLVLGTREFFLSVQLVNIVTGLTTGCAVEVSARTEGGIENDKMPLMLTMISGHCLPTAREGTVYLSAIALNDTHSTQAAKFGTSLSTSNARKIVWASACNGGYAGNTAFNVPCEDKFVADDLEPMVTDTCTSVYWNSMTRVLVNSTNLRDRLTLPFLIEIAGVPKVGKIDVRGRYMAFVDAGVLLEPGQFGVTICSRLLFYNESLLPENIGGLLELPPTSAKTVSARDTGFVTDESGHAAYIVMRFDLIDPLSSKAKMATLFEILGFPPPEGFATPVNELYVETVTEDIPLDVRRIRKEGGALAVHKELSGLACTGKIQMNQSIKRTAANRLLSRMRTLVKQFPPGECSSLEWEDIVTAQHAATRRAVTSSFAPQPPPLRTSSRIAAVRSRLADDTRIAEEHMKRNLIAAPHQPRVLLSKVLRCLEQKNNLEARTYLLRALSTQVRNRYLLWIFGGTEFAKAESYDIAVAAFRIAVKGDFSDGTTGAVGWAALHALHHYNQNSYAAFVATRKMRKAYELPREWRKFLQRWVETSGEEETFWIPATLNIENPMLIASAFFLCLRCYKFSDRLLQCAREGCATRGSRFDINIEPTVDIFYIRAASFVLQREFGNALELTEQGVRQYGPSAIMSQMRAVCLLWLRGWDGTCDSALLEADRAGAETCPWLLLRGALGVLNSNPMVALQRAARAHKVAPSAHSALIISRVYAKTGAEKLAERWAAAAVKTEPLLADGWAFLAIMAILDRNVDKARIMLRTAKQAGPISADIEEELRRVLKIVPIETLPGALVKDLCLCEYY